MNKSAVAEQAKTSSILYPSQGLLQRKCACGNQTVVGGECSACKKKKNSLQRKLAIGESNDPLELEADRVADQVMAAQAHSTVRGAPPRIQRYAGQTTKSTDTAPASVDLVLASSGSPLESALRQDMEQRFDHDFTRVRVHSGATAEQSARDVNAHAYTVGKDIVFGAGRFAPGTHQGRRLLAHELAHVVQQGGSSVASTVQRQQPPPAAPAAPAPAPCPVTPIPPITDAGALAMEGGTQVTWNNTAAGLQTAANNLVGLIQGAGGTATITSAYRPQAYQDHLRAVWDRARQLQNQPQPGPCDAVRAAVNAEMTYHQLTVNRPVAQISPHTAGNAVDIGWTLPAALTPAICQMPAAPGGAPAPPPAEEQCIDNLASQAGLNHPLHVNDRPHFVL